MPKIRGPRWKGWSDRPAIINTYANVSPKSLVYESPQKLYQGPELRLFGCINGTGPATTALEPTLSPLKEKAEPSR